MSACGCTPGVCVCVCANVVGWVCGECVCVCVRRRASGYGQQTEAGAGAGAS